MPSTVPPAPLLTSALGLGLDAFVALRASAAAGVADARASFELTLAAPAPDWGFFVFAGLEPLLDALERLRARPDDLDWLEGAGVIDAVSRRRLESRFVCDLDAAPEGTVVFPSEPVLAVEGPYWQAQLVGGLVESALAEATLVATRFARLSLASGGAELIESGAATAHRLGGAPLLARAAFLGGAAATTSTLAARRYGLPVVAMPPSHLALADASALAHWLAAALAASPLAPVARIDPAHPLESLVRIADAVRALVQSQTEPRLQPRFWVELPEHNPAGMADAAKDAFARRGLVSPWLLLSGCVDERRLLELRAEGSPVRAFAVPAQSPFASAALSRYDLVAIESESAWSPRLRTGRDVASSADPGRKLLVRYFEEQGGRLCPVADVAHVNHERMLRPQGGRFVDRTTGLAGRLDASSNAPLRAPMMRGGKRLGPPESARALRDRAMAGVAALDSAQRRVFAPVRYPVGLSPQLAALKADLLAKSLEPSDED